MSENTEQKDAATVGGSPLEAVVSQPYGCMKAQCLLFDLITLADTGTVAVATGTPR